MPSPLDLCTLAQMKSWITGSPGNSDDTIIQSCITAWGYEFLNRTGLGDQNGDFQQSPFVQVCSFSETYDGKGTYRLFVKNRPIVNVTALMVNGVAVPPSSGVNSQGYVVDGTGKSVALRQGIGATIAPAAPNYYFWSGPYNALGKGLCFFIGIQNVQISYAAGYSSTPLDVEECAKKVVAQNYRRRSWVDEASRAMAAGGGTIRYRDWEIPPECQATVDRYTRTL